VRNQGTVISVADGICRIHGLSDDAGRDAGIPRRYLRPGNEPGA
jgi:hypothetical protein